MKITGNTILVTGGTSGIGAALGQRLHDAGNHVIVAGRRQDALDEVVQGRERMSGIVLDVADPASIRTATEQVVRDHPALNILVNMAGIMKFEDATAKRALDDAEATIATNLLGPIRVTDALIDQLAGAADAAIINVSSGLGFVPLTTTPTYDATKAAIHFYTVALREQLRGKVEVIELVPPAVATELTPGQSKRPGYMPLPEFIDEVMELLGQQPTPPELLVEQVGMQRFAERENRFDETLKTMNEMAAAARAKAGE